MRLTTSGGVLVGIDRGRLERSAIPAVPSARYLAANLRRVTGGTMNILAATITNHQPRHPKSSAWSQSSVSVGHEGLLSA